MTYIMTRIALGNEKPTLYATYPSEIAGHYARRRWAQTLYREFLLDEDQDFILTLVQTGSDVWQLSCKMLSACGRYAYWRIDNNQAPEVWEFMRGPS